MFLLMWCITICRATVSSSGTESSDVLLLAFICPVNFMHTNSPPALARAITQHCAVQSVSCPALTSTILYNRVSAPTAINHITNTRPPVGDHQSHSLWIQTHERDQQPHTGHQLCSRAFCCRTPTRCVCSMLWWGHLPPGVLRVWSCWPPVISFSQSLFLSPLSFLGSPAARAQRLPILRGNNCFLFFVFLFFLCVCFPFCCHFFLFTAIRCSLASGCNCSSSQT